MKMDNLMLRFPHLFEQTFQKLNNESLFKSREVARSWKYFINGRNYPWLCAVNIPTILQIGDSYLHLAAETGQIGEFKTALSAVKKMTEISKILKVKPHFTMLVGMVV